MHIAVVGGGIAGASTAYHLAKAGKKVTIIDSKAKGQATAAGAGIISRGCPNVSGSSLILPWLKRVRFIIRACWSC